jgi:hypothetical protein
MKIGLYRGLVKLKDRYSCYCDRKEKEHQGVQLDIFLFVKKGKYTLKNLGWPSERPNYNMVFPLKKMPFEDIEIWVPNKTKEYLIMEYPASLDLPPIHTRHPHEGRVTPYQACIHPASLKWYNGTLAFNLNNLSNISKESESRTELIVLTILLNLATSCRKEILLYCENPSGILLRILDASHRVGEDDIIFPPIKCIKTLNEWNSLTNDFKNQVYECAIGISKELMDAGNSNLEIINTPSNPSNVSNPSNPTKATPITRFCDSLMRS